jgi:hypothetical protein
MREQNLEPAAALPVGEDSGAGFGAGQVKSSCAKGRRILSAKLDPPQAPAAVAVQNVMRIASVGRNEKARLGAGLFHRATHEDRSLRINPSAFRGSCP